MLNPNKERQAEIYQNFFVSDVSLDSSSCAFLALDFCESAEVPCFTGGGGVLAQLARTMAVSNIMMLVLMAFIVFSVCLIFLLLFQGDNYGFSAPVVFRG
ncbi:MAG: hypothetical protein RQ982_08030, partial [Gammaproteobacteria bacterium]|nr:hypothetical protein [Gammaproteobacteria bacterium]